MAKKISQLPSALTGAEDDIYPVVQSAQTRKQTRTQLRAAIVSGWQTFVGTFLSSANASAARTTIGAAASGANTDITSLTLANGQIFFPGTQVPSSNPNCLDDYEEGTWTPTFSFATPGNLTIVYSSRLGTYTKTGRVFNLDYDIQTTTFTHTTASGVARITGTPFLNATPLPESIGRMTHGAITVSAGYNSIQPVGVASVAQLGFTASNPAGARSILTFTNFPTGVQLVLSGSITCRVD